MIAAPALLRFVVALIAGAAPVLAQSWAQPALASDASEKDKRTVTVVLENDVFYNTDRHYTNGVRASWAGSINGAPDWARTIADWVPFFPKTGDIHTLYTLGQNMYTPSDITLESPPLNDRPYAGWLYGAVGLVKETDKQLDQLTLSLGIVGPSAFAEDTQKFVHRVIDSNDPKGWHAQLGNEPALLLSYQRSWREAISRPVKALTVDVTPTLGAALGNVFTHASVGATVRLGNITPLDNRTGHRPLDFGPPRIQPSAPGSGFFFSAERFTWYLFAGVEGRAVARNIFLDGNTLGHSRSVNSEPLVGDAQFGIVAAWRDWRASYTHVLRTREFAGQRERDDFGAFSVSVRF